MSQIKVYRDDRANAIFLEDANGVQFLNSLHATQLGNNVNIKDLAKNIDLVTDTNYINFVDENDNPYGNDSADVTNELNHIFTATGTPTGDLPVITSPTSINSVEGQTINYELTADFGVGYEWDNLPSGLVTVEGNVRKIIGSLTAGVYTPTMRAVNYNGNDTETLTITVSNPPFANTKSINFVNFDYLSGTASDFNSIFGRPSNGSGVTDAWTFSCYFKAGTSNNNNQTIFNFGSTFFGGGIQIRYNGSQDRIELQYGTSFNNLIIRSQNNLITSSIWNHILITYDGGTTGSASGSINDYYSRFKIFVNGTEVIYNNTNTNFGYSNDIPDDVLQLGRFEFGDYMRNNCRVDEVAFWDSDQQLNISNIYNSGNPFDLSTLGTPPNNWYRMGDGDTYPTLQDSIASSNLTMVNMNAGDIVNDVP